MRKSASACAAFTPIVFSPRSTDVLDERGSTLARRILTFVVVYEGNTHLQPSVDNLSRSPDHWQLCTIVGYVVDVWIEFVIERQEGNMMTPPLDFLLHRSHDSLKPPGTQASQRLSATKRLMEDVQNPLEYKTTAGERIQHG
jgi:hypothetical protein